MARKPRVFIQDGLYHVMLRGNAREQIFFSDSDRKYFYYLLSEGINRYKYHIHAYCLMDNHVHMALQMGDVILSKIIQNIAFRYTRFINSQKNRIGHLFQGRYKAILVESDIYAKELIRYIHLNPVRAMMVQKPEDYYWSSHRGYLGYEKASWLTTDWILSYFANDKKAAVRLYRKYMMEDVETTTIPMFCAGNQKGYDILSEKDFLSTAPLTKMLPRKHSFTLEDLIKFVCDNYSINSSSLRDFTSKKHAKTRAIIAWLAKELNIATFSSVALYLNRDATTLIHAIRKFENKPEIVSELKDLQDRLNSGRCMLEL